ncbi:MAG TPA: type II toxin-antitoxin system VapC family toxin [Sphingomonas sp.]|uniref:type II toxin-antitoxin system VapC family toxin n=1 Tax=Sphingomonas sp. TaxID=28214 RepID=UPI002ED8F5CF
MILLDSNIVIDLIQDEGEWSEWSQSTLARLRLDRMMIVNAVVLAETADRFASVATQMAYMRELGAVHRDIDASAAYRAGLAHRAYRRAGGTRAAILADFLIGGHSSILGATLLTRDRQRFASYFPELSLITPETHP